MKKLKTIWSKITTLGLTILMGLQATCYADVVNEVSGGGKIQKSKLGKGIFNIVKDLTGTLQWLLPIVGVAMCLWFLFKIVTGDEQDQQRYKKSIVKVLVCIVAGLVAVTIVNLIAKYFA